jgi:hypothetical protein
LFAGRNLLEHEKKRELISSSSTLFKSLILTPASCTVTTNRKDFLVVTEITLFNSSNETRSKNLPTEQLSSPRKLSNSKTTQQDQKSPVRASPTKKTQQPPTPTLSASSRQQLKKKEDLIVVSAAASAQNLSASSSILPAATLLPSTTNSSVIAETPDISAVFGNHHNNNNHTPKKTRVSAANSPTKAFTNNNNSKPILDENESLKQVLAEIGESPTIQQFSTKSTQTPEKKRNNDDYDDDIEEIENKTKQVRQSSTNRIFSSSANNSPNRSTRSRSASKNPNRSLSSGRNNNNQTSRREDLSSSSLLQNFSTQQQSWRAIQEEKLAQMIDAPTKVPNGTRVFAFSNEDKGLPGKMVMLRSVRTVEQLKQKISEMCDVKPVGELHFADTGEIVRSIKDLTVTGSGRTVTDEIVATLHGGLPYDSREPPRLTRWFHELSIAALKAKIQHHQQLENNNDDL